MLPIYLMRSILFFCSYFPLTLIICVLQFGVWPLWGVALIFFVPGLGSLAFTVFFFRRARRRSSVQHKKLVSYSRHDADVMSYIASYILPFVTFTLDQVKQDFTLLIFIGVLLILYVRSNMIYINPMLNLAGYHLYEIEIENSQSSHYYIARKELERYHEIRFVELSRDIYLET